MEYAECMMENFKSKLGKKWKLFSEVHRLILSINSDIEFRLFPIYVSYYLGDSVVAVIYFRGKHASGSQLDIGLALEKKPSILNFISAKYMKYPRISYSIKVNDPNDMTKNFTRVLKTALKRHWPA